MEVNKCLREKKIFLLTDGEVDNPEQVIDLARINQDKARVHSFGVGADCSKHLVKEVAKAGRGTYSFVDVKSDNLKGKVISALKKAAEPSLKNCKFNYGVTLLSSPDQGAVGEAFRNELVSQFLILN